MSTIEHQIVKAERLSAIAERVGFALWQLQELEGITAQYYVLVAQDTRGMGLEAGLALTDKALSKTFGSTVSNLISQMAADQILETRAPVAHKRPVELVVLPLLLGRPDRRRPKRIDVEDLIDASQNLHPPSHGLMRDLQILPQEVGALS